MLEKFENALSKQGIPRAKLFKHLSKEGHPDFILELLKAQGSPLYEHQGKFIYKTAIQPISHGKFCIMDIETNGSKPSKGATIIELGAVIYQDGKIIDTFESFAQCNTIPMSIQELTGISLEDTLNAPTLKEVMFKFREFLADCVFVAHDVKFDYNFTSAMMQRVGLEPLQNRKLCTFALAQRSFKAQRYGLKYLNANLKLYSDADHHRALSDAITALELMKLSMKTLPKKVTSVEDLILFSKEAPRLQKQNTKSKEPSK
ncbi:3'-5' exonuclease [Sulfurimonas sp. MAG313]|nr:3'-5' exonuclease [Sulfurimonas sp. MAG313]MDF1880557.1 3'-5' exonuclease [Sulfurimonas sp. MAG313]